ncbi:uncharacterized protein [Venturia canescens]|uniref:uncharacterized protein n=1 Tax=Venturia canescens TaxID=32260 RepID=UPI001C9C71D8|nr:uncharacterized protein LOC122413616 [Venturia canescens]
MTNCLPTMAKSLKFFAFSVLIIGIVNCHVLNDVSHVSEDGIATTSKGSDDYRQKIASETDRATLERNAVDEQNLHLDNLKAENSSKLSRKLKSATTQFEAKSAGGKPCYFKLCNMG